MHPNEMARNQRMTEERGEEARKEASMARAFVSALREADSNGNGHADDADEGDEGDKENLGGSSETRWTAL